MGAEDKEASWQDGGARGCVTVHVFVLLSENDNVSSYRTHATCPRRPAPLPLSNYYSPLPPYSSSFRLPGDSNTNSETMLIAHLRGDVEQQQSLALVAAGDDEREAEPQVAVAPAAPLSRQPKDGGHDRVVQARGYLQLLEV